MITYVDFVLAFYKTNDKYECQILSRLWMLDCYVFFYNTLQTESSNRYCLLAICFILSENNLHVQLDDLYSGKRCKMSNKFFLPFTEKKHVMYLYSELKKKNVH